MDSAARALRRIYQVLDDSTRHRPLLTKAGVGAVLAMVGDGIVQGVEVAGRRKRDQEDSSDSNETPGGLDVGRTARMVCWRSIVNTPIIHYWFNILERTLPGAAPGVVAKKVLLDQLVASPLLHLVFLPYMVLAEGGSSSEALARTSRKFSTVMQLSWCFWPFVHCLTFSVIPLRHRVAWVNVGAVFWMAALSFINESDRKKGSISTDRSGA